jgi:hypothetical protein
MPNREHVAKIVSAYAKRNALPTWLRLVFDLPPDRPLPNFVTSVSKAYSSLLHSILILGRSRPIATPYRRNEFDDNRLVTPMIGFTP